MYLKAAYLRVVLDSEGEINMPVVVQSTTADGPWQLSDLSDCPVTFTLSTDPQEAKEGLHLGDGGYQATLTILD